MHTTPNHTECQKLGPLSSNSVLVTLEALGRRRDIAPRAVCFSTFELAAGREQLVLVHDIFQLNPSAWARLLAVDAAHCDGLLSIFIPVCSDIDDLDIGDRAVCLLTFTVAIEHVDADGVVNVVQISAAGVYSDTLSIYTEASVIVAEVCAMLRGALLHFTF